MVMIMETNLRNTINLTITGYDLPKSSKRADIKPTQTLVLDEVSALQPNKTSEDLHSENIEKEIIAEDLLEKLPETINQLLPLAIDSIGKSSIDADLKVAGNVSHLSLQRHINELRELTNTIQNNHRNWNQSRILSELRKVDTSPDDDILVELAISINCDRSQMTFDEQICFREIKKSLIQTNDLDISRVIVTMDARQHFNNLRSVNSTQSDKPGSVLKLTSLSTKPINSKTYNLTKAELNGKIDGGNIANHMEKEYEMDALFNYYLCDGPHCDGITFNARFSHFLSDLQILNEIWTVISANKECALRSSDQNHSQELKNKQEEELIKENIRSTQKLLDLIDKLVKKSSDEKIEQKIQTERSLSADYGKHDKEQPYGL